MEGFIALLNRVEESSPNPEVQNYCKLVRLAATRGFALFENSAALRAALEEVGFRVDLNVSGVNNKLRETRSITNEAFGSFQASLPDIVEAFMAVPATDALKLRILTSAVEGFSSKKGDKIFDNRSAAFLQKMKAIVNVFTAGFTEDQVNALFAYPAVFYALFGYTKDIGSRPSNLNYFMKHKNIQRAYTEGSEKPPYISAILQVYQKIKETSPLDANKSLQAFLQKFLIDYPIPLDYLRFVFSKYLSEEDLAEVFAMPVSATVKNNYWAECSANELQIVPCPEGSLREVARLCSPFTPDVVDLVCAQPPVGGGKRTRKRRQKKRKSRRCRKSRLVSRPRL